MRDAANGELLAGATVQDSLSQIGVQTNAYGFFSLEVPTGGSSLKISFVGYAPIHLNDISKLKLRH